MTCPKCGENQINQTSMISRDVETVERYKKCKNCGCKFLTIEIEKDLFDNLTEINKNNKKSRS